MTDADLKPHDQQVLQNLLVSLQANYRAQLEKVILFGSKARGDDTPKSDIDVLDELWTKPRINSGFH